MKIKNKTIKKFTIKFNLISIAVCALCFFITTTSSIKSDTGLEFARALPTTRANDQNVAPNPNNKANTRPQIQRSILNKVNAGTDLIRKRLLKSRNLLDTTPENDAPLANKN